jgi:23S rRNA pseudouridine1911/1915/1917 synthase
MRMEETRLTADTAASRLDKYLAEALPVSRTQLTNAIRNGCVTLNGRAAKPGDKVKPGDKIAVQLREPEPAGISAEDIPLDIVYEDADIAVVNKPQGMVVHPAPGHAGGTLVGGLLYALDSLSGVGGQMRPGIVHRLDKDTSGLLVVAKNDAAHAALSAQLADKTARRVYYAIVHGNIKEDTLEIDKPIGRSRSTARRWRWTAAAAPRRRALRCWSALASFTYVRAELKTGRTHQIRVHLSSISHPVAGDPVYGPKHVRLHKGGQLLHAGELSFIHPATGVRVSFTAPLPAYFEDALGRLRKQCVKGHFDDKANQPCIKPAALRFFTVRII